MDELGGFPAALALAKKAARIPDTEDVRVRVFPRAKSIFEALMERLNGPEPDSSERTLMRMLRLLQPVARQIRAIQGQAALEMPAPLP